MPDRRGNGFDRRALQRSLAEAEGRLATVERQIANQRALIAKLDADGRDAGHAKRLLAGLSCCNPLGGIAGSCCGSSSKA